MYELSCTSTVFGPSTSRPIPLYVKLKFGLMTNILIHAPFPRCHNCSSKQTTKTQPPLWLKPEEIITGLFYKLNSGGTACYPGSQWRSRKG